MNLAFGARHTYSIVELRRTPEPRPQGSHRLQCWWCVKSKQIPPSLCTVLAESGHVLVSDYPQKGKIRTPP